MIEQREIRTDILLSITTGVLLVEDFGLMHEASDFIMGYPMMTHHFASKDITTVLRDRVLSDHPDLTPEFGQGITPSNVKEKTNELVSRLGKTRTMTKGTDNKNFGILEGLPSDKNVILVKTD